MKVHWATKTQKTTYPIKFTSYLIANVGKNEDPNFQTDRCVSIDPESLGRGNQGVNGTSCIISALSSTVCTGCNLFFLSENGFI